MNHCHGYTGRWPLLLMFALVPGLAGAADEATESAADAAVDGEMGETTVEPLPSRGEPRFLSDFGRGTVPRVAAVTLTEGVVPSSLGTTWAFTRITGEIPFMKPEQAGGVGLGLKIRLPVAVELVAQEGRSFAGLGNVQLEHWLSWGHASGDRQIFHALVAGATLPVGVALGHETHAYFQYAAETVPALGIYTLYQLYVQGARWDVSAEASVGLGLMTEGGFVHPAGTHLAVTGFRKLKGTRAVSIGGVVTAEAASAVVGFRWLSFWGAEVGVGVNVPLVDLERVALVSWGEQFPLQPMLEVKWRF